jgi:signal transduction histidine kinase
VNARALDALAAVLARGLAALRLLQVVFAGAFVATWWSWYRQVPARWVGPAVVAVWAVLFAVVAVRRSLSRRLVLADVAVAVATGLSAPWFVPRPSLGDGSNWVFIALATAGVTAGCVLRTRWGLLALATIALAGFVPARDSRPQIVTSTVLMIAIVVLLRNGIVRLRRVAAAADAWLDATGARRRAERVAAARARDHREHERLLHDTVLNTLAGIGLGGGDDTDRARQRCADSVAQVEEMLAGTRTEGCADVGMRMGQAIAAAGREGLAVTVDVRRTGAPTGPAADVPTDAAADAPTDSRPTEPAAPGAGPPAEVVGAFAAALSEVLTNVRRHAGTGAAAVTVVHGAGQLRVRVTDDGAGFDPDDVDPDRQRYGLRGSVAGRIADVGGWVEINSVVGCGTRVELNWLAPPAAAVESPDVERLRRDYSDATRRAVGTAALVILALVAVPLVAYPRLVHSVLAAGALWVALVAAVVPAVRVTFRRPLSGREAAGLLAVLLAGVVAGGINTVGAAVVRIVDWPTIVLPAAMMLVTASRPTREWIIGCVLGTGALVAVVLPIGGAQPLVVVRLLSLIYGLWTIQLLVTTAGPVLNATVATTTRAAEADVELAARQQAATAIRRDRVRRLARLDADILPLLRGIAAGTVDPRETTVRRVCANRARTLRRRLLEHSGGPWGPWAELDAAIEAAEARGVRVVLQVDGDLGRIPPDVREHLVETLGAALRSVEGGQVMLTILGSGESGTGYVSFPVPDGAEGFRAPCPAFAVAGRSGSSVPSDPPPVAVRADVEDGLACLELRWPAPAAVP